ncbi:MAG: response regulator [Bacteroidetes bacterium]|nr:response regulator [Bacteroidota bacterium]
MANKMNILHVDDSEKIRSLIKSMLLNLPTSNIIEGVYTLSQAKEELKKEKMDVVILDIQLPDGSGIFFLKWIKENYPKICVIMFSNYSDKHHRMAAKELGADYFFDKSTEWEQILKTIAQLN